MLDGRAAAAGRREADCDRPAVPSLGGPDGRLWAAGDRHPDQAGGAGINVYDLPADDLVGVLAELPDGRVLFVTTSGVTARMITC